MLIALIIICAAAAIFLSASYITYRIAFYNANSDPDDPHRIPDGPKYDILKKEIHALIDDTQRIGYEQVYITSHDSLALAGKFMRTDNAFYNDDPDKRPVALLMHGWHGIAERDFAGGVQNHLERGLNVLLIDQRAHNKSEGHTITFGIKERYDCLDWINYILERFGNETRIIIHGVSMGAATVLMAPSAGLPPNVKGIIADCGYSSPKEIIKKVVRDRKFNPDIIYPFIRLGARLYGRFDPETSSPEAALENNTLPVMFIHGTGDDFVPYEMSQKNYAITKGAKFLVLVPGAPHVMAYMYDTDLYMKVLADFYETALPQT